MYYGYEAVLHRLANLVAMATAVMVRRRLAVVRWDLIPIAIGMTETINDSETRHMSMRARKRPIERAIA